MKTKFVLAGGVITKRNDGKDFLNEVVVKGHSEPVKILDCLFARSKNVWEELFEGDKEFFTERIPEKKFILELADPEKFVEQVKNNDVIYMRGGDTQKLIDLLNKNSEWINFLDGKTIAGTSAGADAVVKYYSDLDRKKVSEGMGLLDVKVIVHWKSDYGSGKINWEGFLNDLENFGEKLPVYKLEEGEFIVLYLDN